MEYETYRWQVKISYHFSFYIIVILYYNVLSYYTLIDVHKDKEVFKTSINTIKAKSTTYMNNKKMDTRESFVKSIADQHVLCLSSILRGHYYSIIKHTLHKRKIDKCGLHSLGKMYEKYEK